MKAQHLDKYCRGWSGRKYAKRILSKARRKAGKHDPENTGSRVRDHATGWYS